MAVAEQTDMPQPDAICRTRHEMHRYSSLVNECIGDLASYQNPLAELAACVSGEMSFAAWIEGSYRFAGYTGVTVNSRPQPFG
jgi:hypothetical protein